MQSVPREKAIVDKQQVTSPPKSSVIVNEAIGRESNSGNDKEMPKDSSDDDDDDADVIREGSRTLMEDESLSKTAADQKSSDIAARYAALRNHRIRFEDAIDPNAERVKALNKNDVIFGRGRGFQNHPGNLRMRTIIERYKNEYHSLRRQGKRDMVEKVYKEIIENGARFLKKVDGEDEWVKVDVPIALQKVSHTLRCRKKLEIPETATVPSASASFLHMHAQGLDTTSSVPPDMLSRASLAMLQQDRSAMTMRGSLSAGYPYVEMEAQRLAALQNRVSLSGLPGITSLMQPMHTNVDYYNMMRQDLLLRDRMALHQQMVGARAMGNTGLQSLPQANSTTFPSLPQGNIYDQLRLNQLSDMRKYGHDTSGRN
ncbi:unnamed protein product [Cylindrotheca closterium]|uniref:DUF6824 domain-containing protein n=1 Tax=Cylindrotheca closterium TaxID=2856 RepID=A0AAD2PVE3_9STRA|nr:unnamed protein product [Cylindrotheca closterium]